MSVSEQQFAALVERVEDLEEENEELQERVDDLEDEKEDLEETVDQQQRIINALRNRTETTKERVEELLEDPPTSDDVDDQEEPALPIQQLAALPEDAADRHLNTENHRNTYRARFMFKDWGDYAERTPAGWTIDSSTMRRVLNAAEDDHHVESRTVLRVMDRLVEFSKGVVKMDKNAEGNWIVYLPPDWEEEAKDVASDGDAPDAVVT